MEEIDLYNVRRIIVKIEQLGIKDNEFKVETVRLIVLLKILKQLAEKYKGEKRLQDVVETINIVFPETDYSIPIVGKVSFFSMVFGEVSYRQKIKYVPLHVILVKTFRILESKKEKNTDILVNPLKNEILTLWQKIDEKFISYSITKGFDETYKLLYTLIDALEKENIPVNIANDPTDEIIEQIKTLSQDELKKIINIYRDTLVALPEIKDSIRFEKLEIPLINALPRYPATDLESEYTQKVKEIVLNANKKAVNTLRDIEDLIKMLPNPNLLAEIAKLTDEKQRKIISPLMFAYSKAYVDLLDKIYLIKEKINEAEL